MQYRAPPPKGKYANLGRDAFAVSVNRLGSKRSGSGHQRRIMVDDDLGGYKMSALGNELAAAHGVVTRGSASDNPGGWVKAHGFRKDLLNKAKGAEICSLGASSAAHL